MHLQGIVGRPAACFVRGGSGVSRASVRVCEQHAGGHGFRGQRNICAAFGEWNGWFY